MILILEEIAEEKYIKKGIIKASARLRKRRTEHKKVIKEDEEKNVISSIMLVSERGAMTSISMTALRVPYNSAMGPDAPQVTFTDIYREYLIHLNHIFWLFGHIFTISFSYPQNILASY